MTGAWHRGVGLAALAFACGAWAPTETAPRPGLRWDAPVGCPGADSVQSQLEALMGASTALDAAAIDGELVLSDAGYVLHLSIGLDGQLERRSVESTDCVLLARTAALLVAITVDAVAVADALAEEDAIDQRGEAGVQSPGESPDVAVRQEAGVVETDAVQPPEPIRSEQAGPGPAPDPPRPDRGDDRWRHGIGAGVAGGVGLGLVPGVTGGLEAHFGWRYGPVRVHALGFHWFSRRQSLTADAGVDAALSGGGVRGCYAPAWGRLDAPLCTGPDIAALHGAGFGSSVRERSAADLWVAWAVGAGLEVRLGRRFALLGRAELVVALRRPALHLDGDAGPIEVFRAPVTGFRLVLGASAFSR